MMTLSQTGRLQVKCPVCGLPMGEMDGQPVCAYCKSKAKEAARRYRQIELDAQSKVHELKDNEHPL